MKALSHYQRNPGINTGSKLFIHDLDDGTTCNPSKSAVDTELGGVADTPQGHAAIQRDLEKLERRAAKNYIAFPER